MFHAIINTYWKRTDKLRNIIDHKKQGKMSYLLEHANATVYVKANKSMCERGILKFSKVIVKTV